MSAKPKGGQRSGTGRRGCLLYHPPLPSGQAHPTYQEGPKHGNGGQEVPDVVIVEEVKEDAVTVVLSGLCGGFLAEGEGQQPTNSALARPGPNPLPPTPWHPLVPDRKHSALTHAFLSPSMASNGFSQIHQLRSRLHPPLLSDMAGGWDYHTASTQKARWAQSPNSLPAGLGLAPVTSGGFALSTTPDHALFPDNSGQGRHSRPSLLYPPLCATHIF